jgi:hypothetical protein
VRQLGGILESATSTAIVTVLAGATLWPIVVPLLGTGTVATRQLLRKLEQNSVRTR